MKSLLRLCIVVIGLIILKPVHAQNRVTGKIIDKITKEPIAGAIIQCKDLPTSCSSTSSSEGVFQWKCNNCQELFVSSLGYLSRSIRISELNWIELMPNPSNFQEIIVSANRGIATKRADAPIAIATITQKNLEDTKPASVDMVLNKISGVNMVNLGNEQHQMSIRQPITTKSLFLYLEDGIPIRTTGLFNHNALLEINMAIVKNIEVIKGPSSSLYGSEAIGGVVNFITQNPGTVPVAKLSVQGSDIGYKRTDLQTSFRSGKWGFVFGGYFASKKNGFLEYSDFHKTTATARIDYQFNEHLSLIHSLTIMDYYSDMAGGIDSTMFVNRSFKNPQTFTYRKVNTVRYRSTLQQNWKDGSKSSLSLIYRDNTIGQNPTYRIKDDYRRQGAVWIGKKDLAHGEINASRFNSYSVVAQHRQVLPWKNASIVSGLSIDLSPSDYFANYIQIKKDTNLTKYVSYLSTDSTLSRYKTALNNYAGFTNIEFDPFHKLHLVTSIRYDHFQYRFDNFLKPSAFTGSPDTTNHFNRLSIKLGATYSFSRRTGIYANYSEGFVPPQVTELYTGVKVPDLRASVFFNYEIGGWMELIKNKLYGDISIYRLKGTNEVVSVRNNDGSFSNQNTGKTSHKGIELGLNANPTKEWNVRFSSAYSRHTFTTFVEKGISYNGKEMNGAPNWIYNTELWYKPTYLKGFRIGVEMQHVGSYFADPLNTASYKGYTVLHIRSGYHLKSVEIWLNVMNIGNSYYATNASKSAFGYSYTLADPRNLTLGISYDIASKKSTK